MLQCLRLLRKQHQNGKYYFSNETSVSKETESKIIQKDPNAEEEEPSASPKTTTKSKNKTDIETENQYTINYNGKLTEKVAKEFIVEDSENQKDNNTDEIEEVENKFIKKYSITAANLLEMDPDFAEGLTEVFKKIYKEYPEAEGYLTNITLWNTSLSDKGIIAAYQPLFLFADVNTSYGEALIFKMRVLLSARYFLNESKMEKEIKSCEKQGWFPENCDIYSAVSHELGHYLSFLAMMKEYGVDSTLILTEENNDVMIELANDFSEGTFSLEMIEEAYKNYKKDYDTDEDIDEWRGHISGYALAQDNEGEYIYDETIAEAFHDVYLNGDDAAIQSQYIVEVLKERLRK